MSYKQIIQEYDFIIDKEKFWQDLITPKKTFFRINTLKASKQQLLNSLKNYKDLEFYESEVLENFYVLEKGSISRKAEHIFGYVFIQDLASGLVVYSFNPFKKENKENLLIVDLCASAGGKTTLLATLYPNSLIIANDLGSNRISALVHNVQRMGALNCIITQCDARFFPVIENASIDLILADVPCSAEANLDNYENYNINKHFNFVNYITKVQYGILNRAIEISFQDTQIVYSTCTFNPLENEQILDLLIKENKIRILPINEFSRWQKYLENITNGVLKYKENIFDRSLINTIRIYPSITKGMFISKMVKNLVESDKSKDLHFTNKFSSAAKLVDIDEEIYFQGYKLKRMEYSKVYEVFKIFGVPEEIIKNLIWFYKERDSKIEEIFVSSIDKFLVKIKGPLKVEYVGMKALKFYKPLNIYKPTSSFLTVLNKYVVKHYVELKFDEKILEKFLLRQLLDESDFKEINIKEDYPFVAVKYNGLVIGCGSVRNGKILSEIPTSKANYFLNLLD